MEVGVRVAVGSGVGTSASMGILASVALAGSAGSVVVSSNGWVASGEVCSSGHIPPQPEMTQARIKTTQRRSDLGDAAFEMPDTAIVTPLRRLPDHLEPGVALLEWEGVTIKVC